MESRCKPYSLCYLGQGDSLSYAGGTLGSACWKRCHIFSSLHLKRVALQACRPAASLATVGNRKNDSVHRTRRKAEMAPGSCVHASSWAIDCSVDPENFHPDDFQQCLSTLSFESFRGDFLVSSLGNSIPFLGLLSAQYLRPPGSAVRQKLDSSVCHKKGNWFILVNSCGCNTALSHRTYPMIRYMERSTTCGCHFIDQLYHLLYSGLIHFWAFRTSYLCKVVDTPEIICWRKRFFSPDFGFSSFKELVPKLMTCCFCSIF